MDWWGNSYLGEGGFHGCRSQNGRTVGALQRGGRESFLFQAFARIVQAIPTATAGRALLGELRPKERSL
ncbi:MAG: hypothetical protein ACLTNK_00295 [Akkermansia muciniphila]